MPPPRSPQLHTRINLDELKAQIVKKLGPDRADQYFYYLHRFLNQTVRKCEFNDRCWSAFGRENIHLHNQFIRSVLKNACNGSPPPPPLTPRFVGKKEDGERQSGNIYASMWPNGDVPPSPRKARSSIHNRRIKDRFSPLGPYGKTLHQPGVVDEFIGKNILENGMTSLCDLGHSVQQHHGVDERPEAHSGGLLPHSVKIPQAKPSLPNDGVSVNNAGFFYQTVSGAGLDMERDVGAAVNRHSSPLRAPLGIPFCPASVGGARRTLPGACSSSFTSFVDNSELSDSETLKKHMQQIAGSEGLDGVSLECANLLNNGLDAYLKRLIKSCIDLGRARSGHETARRVKYKEQPQGKIINGQWLDHHAQTQRNIGFVDSIKDGGNLSTVSLQDFKVAMELHPPQLGEEWPLLLEKVCCRMYEK